MNIRRYAPYWLKRIIVRVYVALIAATCLLRPRLVRLSLAGVLPAPGLFLRGGRVKLQHLRERFGDVRWRYNILYLVSSSLPSNPDIWVNILRWFGVHIIWNQNGVAYPAWVGSEEKVKRINAPMRLLRKASHVIYQSKFCKESADRWVGPAIGDWSIIPNCVDTDVFIPQIPPNKSPLTLITLGSHFTPEKILIALEALAILRKDVDVRLILGGRFEWPEADKQIQSAIDQYQLNNVVTITGYFLQSEAPALYQQGDIFLHLKYMDPCPTAVIEAMACGLPIVGLASGGMPELVDNDSGILIPVPKDWSQLHYPRSEEVVRAVNTILPTITRYKAAARQRAVKYFGKENWLKLHKQIFDDVIRK